MTSIRSSLVRWITGATILVVLLAGAATYTLARAGLRRQADDALLARARNFASLVIIEQPDPDENDEGGLTLDYKGSLDEAQLGALLRVALPDGAAIAESPGWPSNLDLPHHADDEPGDEFLAHTRLPDGRAARVASIVALAGAEPETDDEDDDEADDDDELLTSDQLVVVTILGDENALRAALHAVLLAVVLGALAAGAGAWLVVTLAVFRGLRPLTTLAAQLRAMPERDPHPIARARAEPAEIAPITGALNDLLSRVRAAVERERRFTDAAAHELRTPLAELRALADVAARHPEPDRLAHAAREAGAIGRELTELIESLLHAARADSPRAEQRERTPLAPLIDDALRPHRANLQARAIAIEESIDPDAAWLAAPGAARMIVRNLIDNAADYTRPGGVIRITAARRNNHNRLEVGNGPTDLAPDALERIFEPFWRADASRTDRAHRGLGLAIVATQCDAARLTRHASLDKDRALVITIESNGP